MTDEDFDCIVAEASAGCRGMTEKQKRYLLILGQTEWDIQQLDLNIVTASVLITRLKAERALARERHERCHIEMAWDEPAEVSA